MAATFEICYNREIVLLLSGKLVTFGTLLQYLSFLKSLACMIYRQLNKYSHTESFMTLLHKYMYFIKKMLFL